MDGCASCTDLGLLYILDPDVPLTDVASNDVRLTNTRQGLGCMHCCVSTGWADR